MTATFDTDELVEPLAAFASLPDWLAAAMQSARVAESLARHVPQLSGGRLALLDCAPQRLRAKGSDWLARYELTVAEPGGEPRTVVLVGELRPPGHPVRGRRGDGAFRSDGWHCVLPDLGLELHPQERDEALPALESLVQPCAAAELLEPVLQEAGYDGARITSCEPVVVRYKPGSRCTVVVHLGYAGPVGGPSPVVLKIHQGDKGQSAWAAMNALWARQEAWRDAVRLAEPLGYLREQRILVQGPVPETLTLKELAREAIARADRDGLDRLREELAKTARALAALHGCRASYPRTESFEDELLEVDGVVRRLSLSVPDIGTAAAPLLAVLGDRAAAVPAEAAVPAHHDFRPAQVLLHDGHVGFIDFDGACMVEPALDLGRFRAKLRDIGVSTLGLGEQPVDVERVEASLRLLDDLCEHFLGEYQRHAVVSRERVVLWETCDLLTGLLHAWTKVRLLRVEPRLTALVHQIRSAL